MLQLALTVSIYLLIVIPAGVYLYHIAAGKHTLQTPSLTVWTERSIKSAEWTPGRDELETVCPGSAGDERRDGVHRVSDPARAERRAFQPEQY